MKRPFTQLAEHSHIDCFMRPLRIDYEEDGIPDYRLLIFESERAGERLFHMVCPELGICSPCRRYAVAPG